MSQETGAKYPAPPETVRASAEERPQKRCEALRPPSKMIEPQNISIHAAQAYSAGGLFAMALEKKWSKGDEVREERRLAAANTIL